MGSARTAPALPRCGDTGPDRLPCTPPVTATRTGEARPMSSSHERDAMRRALRLAATPGVPFGPNPRVGCVLLDDEGRVVAEGHHRGAGTPHAEVDALSHVGDARGLTAVV